MSLKLQTYEMHTSNFITELYSMKSASDMELVRDGIRIRRTKRKRNRQNEDHIKCSVLLTAL